jgi:hypothetical protein
MNVALAEKSAFPGVSTDKVFARIRLLGIRAASSEKSSRLGHPAATVTPCEGESADYNQAGWPETEENTWTEPKNQRRCDLIDRKYQGKLTPVEACELARLQALMLRHRQRVAPLPLEDALRLCKELLAGVNSSRAPTDQ